MRDVAHRIDDFTDVENSLNQFVQQAQQQWEQEQANAYMQGRNSYSRAFGACQEGRGYTVK